MLLSHRPSPYKLLGSVVFIILCSITLYLYPSWHLDGYRGVIDVAMATKSTTPTPIQTVILPEPTAVSTIPKRLWYKLGPQGLSDQAQFKTDDSCDAYVQLNYASRPDIVEIYLALTIPILKADFLRYLLLYTEGGIWNDLDVSCGETPIDDWIPEHYRSTTNLVVGWEFDIGWGENIVRQFASWTIMANAGYPHLSMVIDDIVEGIRQKTEEHNVAVAELTMEMIGDVVNITGPRRRLTRSITKSLSMLHADFDEGNIARIQEPIVIGDVLILPGYAFANSSNHYGEDKGQSFVTHHFAGSWKNEVGGEKT